MRTRHYFVFEKRLQDKFKGSSLNKENWDILRMDKEQGAFAIERNIENFENNCMKADMYINAAKAICDIFLSVGIDFKKIISLGAGKGILEWHLKKMKPELIIECTDYTVGAVEQLKQVFLDLDAAYQFDMLNGDYTQLDKKSVVIMYRVSTEFSLKQWYSIFKNMYDAGIIYIIFVPAGLNNLRDMINERITHIKNVVKRRKDIQCGWIYSENEYLKMFRGGAKRKREPLYIVIDKKILKSEHSAVYLLMRNSENMKGNE